MQNSKPKQASTVVGQNPSTKGTVATGDELLQQARDAADGTVHAASDIAEDLKTSVSDAAAKIGTSVADKADKVQQEATKTVRTGAQKVADRGKGETQKYVRSIGRALTAGSRSLEDDGLVGMAGYAGAAGRGLENAADEIEGFDTQSLTTRVEAFVYDRPMVTVGLLALVGFALAGTLKSSGGSTAPRSQTPQA